MTVDPTPGRPTFPELKSWLESYGWDFASTKIVSVDFHLDHIEVYEYEVDENGGIKAEKDKKGNWQPIGHFRQIPYAKGT